jgi:DNA-3-methyladenine glycosylase II
LYKTYSTENITTLCDDLVTIEPIFGNIIQAFGYPDLYTRPANFESLLRIILEQQVSLASAKAAYTKLIEKVENISPKSILSLSDDELKSCYFSRQKIVYARALAYEITHNALSINELEQLSDHETRTKLTAIKGIGNWTADVFLMMCLQRCDLFPIGDIALVNSFKKHFGLPKETPASTLLELAEAWRPLRSIATIILWHVYIKERGIVM